MNKDLRNHLIELLKDGEDIPAEFEEDLFPTTKKEYELKYAGKERKEKILSDTMSVPTNKTLWKSKRRRLGK